MSTSGKQSRISDSLHESMQQFVDRGPVPGLVYLVEKADVTYTGALGRATSDGTPMQMDSIFRIASLSKPIAGAATMRLVEDGTLRLDQKVEQLLPELAKMRVLRTVSSEIPDTVPMKRSITIEDLLTFRMGTGIIIAPPGTYPIQRAIDAANLGIGPPDPAATPDPEEWLRRFAKLPLVSQPGESWMYVASSELLGVLLARATGMPLHAVLDELILGPLGMSDTSFSVPSEKVPRFTSQFAREHESGELVEIDSPARGKWNQAPAFPSAGGGLVSTINDFGAFARMMLKRGSHEGKQIVSEELIDQMTSNHLTEEERQQGEIILGSGNGWGYCLGVRVEQADEPGSPGSYGWNGGFGTTWLNDPEQEMVALLFTQLHFDSPALPESARRFLELAYEL